MNSLPAGIEGGSPCHLVDRQPQNPLGAGIAGQDSAVTVLQGDALCQHTHHRSIENLAS